MATIRPTPALRAPATLAPFVPPAETPTPDEPTPAPLPTATPVAAEPEPTPTPAPTATPPPTPAPTPTATPRPPASIAPPSTAAAAPQAQRDAARVQQLLERADAALAAGRHDEAIGLADEALALEPGNSRATETRAQAVARRDLARRRFVTGRTRVQTEKAEGGGGLAGFDTGDADLRRAPDFQGRIEFEMTPSSGLSAGTAWTLRIFVVNEGKKPIQIRDVTATTEVNGSGSGSPVTPRSRQVPTQQRALIGEISGTWSADTTAWSTQVTITANKGDSLRGTLAWR
jgi:hypothetical protein